MTGHALRITSPDVRLLRRGRTDLRVGVHLGWPAYAHAHHDLADLLAAPGHTHYADLPSDHALVPVLDGFSLRALDSDAGWHFGGLGLAVAIDDDQLAVTARIRPAESPHPWIFGLGDWTWEDDAVHEVTVGWALLAAPRALVREFVRDGHTSSTNHFVQTTWSGAERDPPAPTPVAAPAPAAPTVTSVADPSPPLGRSVAGGAAPTVTSVADPSPARRRSASAGAAPTSATGSSVPLEGAASAATTPAERPPPSDTSPRRTADEAVLLRGFDFAVDAPPTLRRRSGYLRNLNGRYLRSLAAGIARPQNQDLPDVRIGNQVHGLIRLGSVLALLGLLAGAVAGLFAPTTVLAGVALLVFLAGATVAWPSLWFTAPAVPFQVGTRLECVALQVPSKAITIRHRHVPQGVSEHVSVGSSEVRG